MTHEEAPRSESEQEAKCREIQSERRRILEEMRREGERLVRYVRFGTFVPAEPERTT